MKENIKKQLLVFLIQGFKMISRNVAATLQPNIKKHIHFI